MWEERAPGAPPCPGLTTVLFSRLWLLVGSRLPAKPPSRSSGHHWEPPLLLSDAPTLWTPSQQALCGAPKPQSPTTRACPSLPLKLLAGGFWTSQFFCGDFSFFFPPSFLISPAVNSYQQPQLHSLVRNLFACTPRGIHR